MTIVTKKGGDDKEGKGDNTHAKKKEKEKEKQKPASQTNGKKGH